MTSRPTAQIGCRGDRRQSRWVLQQATAQGVQDKHTHTSTNMQAVEGDGHFGMTLGVIFPNSPRFPRCDVLTRKINQPEKVRSCSLSGVDWRGGTSCFLPHPPAQRRARSPSCCPPTSSPTAPVPSPPTQLPLTPLCSTWRRLRSVPLV